MLNLPQLDRNAVWNLFQYAFSAKLKAVVLDILLSEVFEADLLKSFSYRERVLYANLLLHIISGESAAPDMPRFPEQAGGYTYCFDPQHCFDPDSIPQ